MKRTITAIAVSVSTLLTTQALAGHTEMAGNQPLNPSQCESKAAALSLAEQSVFMKSCLAEASSPENVRAVALRQKKAYCDKNVKNKALQGSEKESYLTACMNNNEAQAQFAQLNRDRAASDSDIASMDFDKALQKFTGFVTALLKTSPAGGQ